MFSLVERRRTLFCVQFGTLTDANAIVLFLSSVTYLKYLFSVPPTWLLGFYTKFITILVFPVCFLHSQCDGVVIDCMTQMKSIDLKGTVHPKIILLTIASLVQNLFEVFFFFFWLNTKQDIVKNVGNLQPLSSIEYFVFNKRKELLKVWNHLMVNTF